MTGAVGTVWINMRTNDRCRVFEHTTKGAKLISTGGRVYWAKLTQGGRPRGFQWALHQHSANDPWLFLPETT